MGQICCMHSFSYSSFLSFSRSGRLYPLLEDYNCLRNCNYFVGVVITVPPHPTPQPLPSEPLQPIPHQSPPVKGEDNPPLMTIISSSFNSVTRKFSFAFILKYDLIKLVQAFGRCACLHPVLIVIL